MQTSSRVFWLFLIAVSLMIAIEMANSREKSEEDRPDMPRYRPYLPNYLLPIFFAILLPIVLFGNSERMEKMVLSLGFSVFLHIGVYYLLLCFLMPALRKVISSRVCAALWLLPNYLYLMINGLIAPRVPKWAVYVPETVLRIVFFVWLTGFVVVFSWKIKDHFAFRDQVLGCARRESDPEIVKLWWSEQARAGFHGKDFELVRSPVVTTPLTIGFFKNSTRVILPERDYTLEELRLIFRHELVHIGREDAATKFFLAFCTAMCWFNPLMWLAMRRSADDLELSCDETVLLEAEDNTRRQYAELILTTAGDERGFTTCLSASAKALRYRLRYVMQSRKRLVGGFAAGVVFFTLLMTCGYVTLAYDRLSGAQCIFGGGELAQYAIVEDVYWQEPGRRYVGPVDTAGLSEYLAGLTVYEIADQYDFSETERYLDLDYRGPDGETRLSLTDHVLSVHRPGDRFYHQYFVQEDIDWEYLESLLI